MTTKAIARTDESTWAVLAHLSGLLLYWTALGHLIAPLVIWLCFKDNRRVTREAKESLNFQISMTLYMIVAWILCFVFIGFVLVPIVGALQLILPIVAAVRVSDGHSFHYPLSIRFLK